MRGSVCAGRSNSTQDERAGTGGRTWRFQVLARRPRAQRSRGGSTLRSPPLCAIDRARKTQTLSRQHVDAQSDHTNTLQSTRSPVAPRPAIRAIRAAALRSSFDRICPTGCFPPALFSRSCFARKRSCRFARDQYAPPRSSWPTCSSAGASAGRFSGRVGFLGADSAVGASDSLETSGVQVERRTCSSRASRAPA